MKDDQDKIIENPEEERKEVSLDETMETSDYDIEVSEEDFFDELDEGIDNYFQNLRKKK